MKRFKRILVTGAAGRLGTQLRQGLVPLAENLRITDRVEMEDVQPHEEAIVADLGDYDTVMEMTKDVDAICHFGGTPNEQPFEEILNATIRGSYHIYEGARKNGVGRVIYASSNHAIGFHPLSDNIDADAPWRPDTLYGVSKCYVEALSRLYFDKWQIETVCFRIFSSFEEPLDRRMLWSWLSYRDFVGYVSASLTAPSVGHTILFGASANKHQPFDNRKAGHIGYMPVDNTEAFREEMEAKTEVPDPNAPWVKYLGGKFVEFPNPDDDASVKQIRRG